MAEEKLNVGRMQVRKVEYDVFLEHTEPTKWRPQGSGRFSMTVSGKDIYADTWEHLYEQAMVASKQPAVKLNVPLLKLAARRYSRDEPSTFIPITMTGRHAENGNYLMRQVGRDGKSITTQTERWDVDREYYLPMSKEDQALGLQLMAAERKAEAALGKWKSAHSADLAKLFDAAEREAMEALDREEGR